MSPSREAQPLSNAGVSGRLASNEIIPGRGNGAISSRNHRRKAGAFQSMKNRVRKTLVDEINRGVGRNNDAAKPLRFFIQNCAYQRLFCEPRDEHRARSGSVMTTATGAPIRHVCSAPTARPLAPLVSFACILLPCHRSRQGPRSGCHWREPDCTCAQQGDGGRAPTRVGRADPLRRLPCRRRDGVRDPPREEW